MSCPWAKIEKPEPVNLVDIISEEVTRDLQEKEEKTFSTMVKNDTEITENTVEAVANDIPTEILKAITNDSFEDDAMIAQLLQMQFDNEYDEELRRTEEKYNGASKVSISFENYKRTPLNNDFISDSEEEDIIDIHDRENWDRFDHLEDQLASVSACGYRKKDEEMITKQDIVLSGRKNAHKLLSFPAEFQTGDGEMLDLKLSNNVFNSRKMHSRNKQSRRHRIHGKKEQAITVFGIDHHIRLLLYKMISSDKLLQGVNSVISVSKEAVILHASVDPSYCSHLTNIWPRESAIKVFKTTLSEFKHIKYFKDYFRVKDRLSVETTRPTNQLWAEKEMANLLRLTEAGVLCPQPMKLIEPVVVMSFIGKDGIPAPDLKDAKLSDSSFIAAYDQVKNGMKTLYEKGNKIHANLSEYNLLWHDEQCYFIGVRHAVGPMNKYAYRLLYRDCVNITNFFRKRIPEIDSPEALFRFITGLSAVRWTSWP